MALIGNNFNIPPHVFKHMGGNLVVEGESWLPEDAETADIADLRNLIDEAFDKKYPRFEPEIIHTFGKDYFLPALKVLRLRHEEYYSPTREVKWSGMELAAECLCEGTHHVSPHKGCDCGVYGSVNLEEIIEYMRNEKQRQRYMTPSMFLVDDFDYVNGEVVFRAKNVLSREPEKTFSLCIVEPSPDSTYHLTRKGWKASRAFISEILGETMGFEEASSLLSIAWHRPLDLRRLYENR